MELNTNDEKIENFSKLTYRQRFAITEYGYLLSPENAELVGKMLGNFQEKDVLPFCRANGRKVSKSQKITPAEIANKNTTARFILTIISVIYSLALCPISFFVLLMQVDSPALNTFVTMTFPLTIIVSIVGSWVFYKQEKIVISLLMPLLPFIHLAISYFVPGIWSNPYG